MKKFLFSFVLASASFISFAQNPCATTFNVVNNGGGSCAATLAGDDTYKREGLVEIRSVPSTSGAIDLKFSLKGFGSSGRSVAQFCFYSATKTNLNNASGATYEVDITYTLGNVTSTTTCIIEQAQSPIGLPVTFGDFVAQRKSSSSVFLKWSTLSEQNNKGFYVQRNTGNGWKDAGFVFSQTNNGYSSSNLVYEFKDVNGEKATTQYRILQVDNDGHGKYSDIRLVRGEAGSGKVVLYPNPTNTGKVSIAFENNSERDITVHDMSGRIVKQLSKVTNSNVVIDGLTSGFYTIQTVDRATSEVTREKLIVNNK
jgi:hypothetical protein